jgi:nicotinamide phosphoribosyltransferase
MIFLMRAQNYWGGALKDKVLNAMAFWVIRPDSGDPVMTWLKVFEILIG